MLILAPGVTHESIGRLTATIDATKKVVTLRARDGTALVESEVAIMRKYLKYHHPEIINPHGLATGWSITGDIEVAL
jgi:hypothetical protein